MRVNEGGERGMKEESERKRRGEGKGEWGGGE